MELDERLIEDANCYRRLVEMSFDTIVIYQDYKIVFINDTGVRIMGAPREQLLGQPILRFIPPAYHALIQERARYMFTVGKQTEPVEIEVNTMQGQTLEVEVTGIAITYERAPAVLTIIRDIQGRKRQQREMEHLAYHDSLTGLPNRRWFERHAFSLLQHAEENDRQACLFFIDFDMFKHVNDSFGHQFGDLLLQEISNRLLDDMTEHRHCIRMGGDEFALLLLDIRSEEEAFRHSERILEKFRLPFELMGIPFHSTCSIGIAMLPEHGATSYKLLKSADIALHQAKLSRNCAIMYSHHMEQHSMNVLTIISDIHQALRQGWLVLHYQPQFHMETGKLLGTEALIRLQHPDKGMLSPGSFIPVAEMTGLIVPIGRWILFEACRQNMRWLGMGMPPMTISVNIAMRQFQENDFVQSVFAALQETGMPAELLELEITESCASDTPKLEQVLHELRPLGVQISIDDFGTGYSSLSHLSRLRVDKLKIDRSFIVQMLEHERDENLVRTIISIAHNLNMKVVAEGMETHLQAHKLKGWGCDIAQGYFYAKPQKPEQIYELYGSA
ncbi:putative bifunctional diguanylate cyclase/phosphodiesterase [Paenibacillus cymbidii]|uniref:putative bifunctional diguanylate cyclase/phosphodiesterase n=1 Tax=Paenibacillus cymbidii TaxID=1639034 RepID=UPI0010809586|nr:GGDEF and EAL domain-containing protein [Paenibacillus cymbidii]